MKWAVAVCGANPAFLLRWLCARIGGLEFQALRTRGLRPRLYAEPAEQAKPDFSGKDTFTLTVNLRPREDLHVRRKQRNSPSLV